MSDNMNPWGNRDKKPSELDEIIQKGLKKIFNIKQGNKPPSGQDSNLKPPGMNFGIVVVLLLILFLGFQSVYQIQPNEQGVVLRFGKFNNVTSPGLNFLIPLIEKVIKVDV